jgi:hypothetical protein
MTKTVQAFLLVLALAVASPAQTKISGVSTCAAPDQFQKIDIGDKPDHAFAISHGKCTWTKPMDMAGIQTHDDVVTGSDEINGTSARTGGYVVGTMSNGDKFTVQTTGTDTYKDGKPVTSEGTWSFTNGTGKLKGIKGKGTYKGTPDAQGNMVFAIKGDYTLPKK